MRARIVVLASIAGVGLFALPASAGAATTLSFPGASNPPADQIEVLSYSWGVKSPRDVATGQSSGKRQHLPLSVGTSISEGSNQLALAAEKGRLFQHILLSYRANDGSGFGADACVENAEVMGYQVGGSAESRPTESLSLNYSKIEWTYSFGSEHFRFFWDLKENKGGITDEVSCA
jgi:type VI secretion system Hcp family effector